MLVNPSLRMLWRGLNLPSTTHQRARVSIQTQVGSESLGELSSRGSYPFQKVIPPSSIERALAA